MGEASAMEMAELKVKEAADRGNTDKPETRQPNDDGSKTTDEAQQPDEVEQLIEEEMSSMIQVKPAEEERDNAAVDKETAAEDAAIVDEELKKMDGSTRPDEKELDAVQVEIHADVHGSVNTGKGEEGAGPEAPAAEAAVSSGDGEEQPDDTAYDRLMAARKEGKDLFPEHSDRKSALRKMYAHYVNNPRPNDVSSNHGNQASGSPRAEDKQPRGKSQAHLVAMEKFASLLDMQLRMLQEDEKDMLVNDREFVRTYVKRWEKNAKS